VAAHALARECVAGGVEVVWSGRDGGCRRQDRGYAGDGDAGVVEIAMRRGHWNAAVRCSAVRLGEWPMQVLEEQVQLGGGGVLKEQETSTSRCRCKCVYADVRRRQTLGQVCDRVKLREGQGRQMDLTHRETHEHAHTHTASQRHATRGISSGAQRWWARRAGTGREGEAARPALPRLPSRKTKEQLANNYPPHV